MPVDEIVIVELKEKGFKEFANSLNKVRAATKNLSINQVRNNQAMQGFNTRINALNKQLEPLKKGLKDSFQQMSRPAETAEQKVQGILNSQTSLNKQSKIMEKQLRQTGFERMASQADSLRGVFKLTHENWREINQRGIAFQSIAGKAANKTRMMTSGMKGFRMEMLGVMFMGMAMVRMFGALLKPAAQVFGIFELWTTTLQIFFLPIMTAIFPILLDLMSWFMDLDPAIQTAVGVIVLLGLALGFFLMMVGQLALGIGSLLVVGIGPVLWFFGAVLAVFAGVGFIIAGFIKVFKGEWEGFGLIIMGIGIILLLFIGWWALIPIAVGAVIFLLVKHWKGFSFFFKQLWLNMKILFFKSIDAMITKLGTFVDTMAKLPNATGLLFKGIQFLFKKAAPVVGGSVAILEAELESNKVKFRNQQAIDDLNNTLEDMAGGKSGGISDLIPSFDKTQFDKPSVVINQENNVTVDSSEDALKKLDEIKQEMVDEINRSAPGGN